MSNDSGGGDTGGHRDRFPLKMMSHMAIAFLLLGALAPFYVLAAIWDRGEKYTRVRGSSQAGRSHRSSCEIDESKRRARSSAGELSSI